MSRCKPRRKSRRRGVTLIFVVSLIAMFMLLGATFAVISANYLKSSRQNAQREVYNDPPQVSLERVLYTVLRGTSDRNTPAAFHDLGADIYGFQGFKATVTTPEFVANSGNTFLALRVDAPPQAGARYPTLLGPDGFGNANRKLYIAGGRFDNSNYDISQFAGAYNGQVLTFISGPAKGISSRIVGYSYDTMGTPNGGDDSIRFYIMVDSGDTSISALFNPANQAQPNPGLVNADFLVNARPFTGKGAGELKPAYQNIFLDQIPPDQAAFVGAGNAFSALRVNRVGDTSGIDTGYLRVGPNESYDVADYQNMFMAAVIQASVTYNDIAVIPSYHRPALIGYLDGKVNPDQIGNFSLRPIRNYNKLNPIIPAASRIHVKVDAGPEFPGPDYNLSASNATQFYRQLADVRDVDNDGDLINDSVWVDFGLPVQTDVSGRRYKALAAVLCLDMDGRLNVNTDGTKFHQDGGYAIDAQQSAVPLVDSTGNFVSTQLLQNRGPGYGPPEISLRTAFADNAEYVSLLYGNATLGLPGRYGMNGSPGIPGIDPLERDKLYGYPNSLFGNWYGSYLDIQGRFAVGIDINGGPRFDTPTIPNDYADNPYELNLLNSGSGLISLTAKDQPFSAAEAERFLRPNDIDSAVLPDRLWRMSQRLWNESTGTARNDTYRTRRSLTTDSYDVPTPSRDMLRELTYILTYGAGGSVGPLDPALAGGSSPPSPLDVSNQASGMLDRDLLMGLRMDINWAFGNGLDDNNNGVRDEAAIPPDPSNPGTPAPAGVNESMGNEPLWGGTANFDHDFDGTAAGDADAYLARMHFARKLFVLALMMHPNIALDLDDGSAEDDGNPSQIEARKIIAQWVANVVDFRDTDSIMTPFEFDLNPFDGWHLDGYIGTDETAGGAPPPPFQGQPSRYVVWGSERPELLIFETLAAHDRRTEDLDNEQNGHKTTDNNNPDDDFDQRVRPRGLFYLELVNPWSNTNEAPAELYSTVNGKTGVDLRRLDYATGTSPIWRVLVVKDAGKGRDPDTPSLNANDVIAAGDKERSIYFTAAANIPADTHGQPYTPDNNVLNDMGIIGLQEYAVIGSAGSVNGGVYTMPIGMRRDANLTTDLKIPQTRRIELEPGANQCRIYQPDPANPANLTAQTRNCVAVPVQDFTVSEPTGGYAAANYADNGLLEFSYQPPVDEPFDRARADNAFFNQDGTVNNFREVHLQRLANPLVPFHAVTNPYRTIDSMSVDLTVFNGQAETDATEEPGGVARTEAEATGWVAEENIVFSSKERGEYEVDNNVPANRSRVIWEHEPNSPAAATADTPLAGDQHYFSFNLGKTYGALGKVETLGILNFPYDIIRNPKFAGVAPVGVPWLVWNNRPYVSQLEMMIVPKGRSSRLLHDYSLNTGFQSYDYSNPANQNPTFGYLLNFFQSTNGSNEGPDLHRLFEFTHVPSRFAGTETWLNPAYFQGNDQTTGINGFNAPFNQVSSYRYPGKMNLNTINQVEGFQGLYGRAEGATANLTDYFGGHPGPSWGQFVASRAGYNGAQPGPRSAILASNSAYPTFFANPFRSPQDGNMVPELAGSPNLLVRPDSECGLLRSDMIDTSGGINAARTPLFESKNLTEPFNDNNRNPYFRYESLQRLGNLTTTHSNVYAIWITIGYFEVDAAGRLGKELGSDVGKVKRHRMFSMVDRSIPFAYEPGKNHNIDRIILTKRFIE